MLFPLLRFSGVALPTLVLLVGNCNSVGHGSRTEVSDSTLMTGKSRLTGVLAGENAARVSTAPSEADIAVEMCWASCTASDSS